MLFQGDDTAHDCITFYNYPHAATAKEVINLSAMRCGDHKVYWWVAGAPPAGVKPGPQPEGKPLVFNLAKDPSEDSPLDSSTADYAQAVKTAEAARVAHLKTIEIVSDIVHSPTFPVRVPCLTGCACWKCAAGAGSDGARQRSRPRDLRCS